MMYLVRLKGLLKLNEVMGELGKYEVKEPHIKTEQIVVGKKCVNLVDVQATIILKEEFTMNLYYNLQNMIQKAKSITMGTVVRNETLSGDKLKQILPEFTFMQINELKEFKPQQPAFNIEEEPKDGNIKSFIDKCKECVENGCLDKYEEKEIEETEPFADSITGNPDDKCYVFSQYLMGNISNFHDLFIPTITPMDTSDLSLEELFKKFWGEKEEEKLKNKLDDAINNLKASKGSEVQDIIDQGRKINSMMKVMDKIFGMDINALSPEELNKEFSDIADIIKKEKLVDKDTEKRIDSILDKFKTNNMLRNFIKSL